MKKVMTSITTGIVIATMTAPVLSIEYADDAALAVATEERALAHKIIRETMQKGVTDDAALRNAIRLIGISEEPKENIAHAQELARELKIPDKRLVEALEYMIRENLSAIEKDEKIDSVLRVVGFLEMLEIFPNYDALSFVKKCLLSKDEKIRYYAVKTYVNIEGVNSIPFLRETIKNGSLGEERRNMLFRHFETITAKLKEENKTDDVTKFNAFLNEMKQAEQPKEKGAN
jgi:hypothetical protein